MTRFWMFLICCSFPAALLQAQFAGTWKLDVSTAQFPQQLFKWELSGGTYRCLHSDPPFSVPADGAEHLVKGHPAYDSVGVRVIDDRTVEVFRKKTGKLYLDENFKVAPDGMTMTDSFALYNDSSEKPALATALLRRVGNAISGPHPMSGSWIQEGARDVSENALLATIVDTPDGGIKMSAATGEHYQAKFDGKEYPYQGDPDVDTVVLRRPEARVIEETLKRQGKIQRVTVMTFSEDGNTMTMDIRDYRGRQSKFIWKKQ